MWPIKGIKCGYVITKPTVGKLRAYYILYVVYKTSHAIVILNCDYICQHQNVIL